MIIIIIPLSRTLPDVFLTLHSVCLSVSHSLLLISRLLSVFLCLPLFLPPPPFFLLSLPLFPTHFSPSPFLSLTLSPLDPSVSGAPPPPPVSLFPQLFPVCFDPSFFNFRFFKWHSQEQLQIPLLYRACFPVKNDKTATSLMKLVYQRRRQIEQKLYV